MNNSEPLGEYRSLSPEELYGQLFFDVMSADELFGKDKLFNDCKDFVDCLPKNEIEIILTRYSVLENRSDPEVLSSFIRENFEIPVPGSTYADSSEIDQHIFNLWNNLKREPDQLQPGTLIPLRHPYLVPGGRFREIYYWDTYFTMLGLQADGQDGMIRNMINNFSDLIDQYGFVPNGNRTYYLSRSQPPFYALMIELLSDSEGDHVFTEYLKYMIKEYDFWMKGSEELDEKNSAIRHVVLLKGGETLNRYYDNGNTPRAEMYRADVETASLAKDRTNEEVFRDLRSAAESGWDFSSRWLANKIDLCTVETTSIIPVDLNSLLYNLELTIAKALELCGDPLKAKGFKDKSEKRRNALVKYCWNKEKGFFMDYNFRRKRQTDIFSLAGAFPLFFRIATREQALLAAGKIKNSFLKQGGVVSTLHKTTQQWDYPNGWAPLQWITIAGLRNYGENELAGKIKARWLALNELIYKKTHRMLEKYDVVGFQETGGGEYPGQDGFGWTNGVYKKLSGEKRK
ncbi:MAG: alpha,alpha-trehalase TreF [Bacteroidales bacterium]|jgi:alpha,alpha-trehalase